MSKVNGALQNLASLEELSANHSPIHNCHAAVKILVTLVYLLAVVSCNRYDLPRLISLCFYPAFLIPLAKIPFAAIIKRALLALAFSLFAGVANIIFERETAITLFGIAISYGFISFLVLILKTLLCVSAVLILAATTGSFQLFGQLRRWRVPKILILTLMMTYRYIFLLLLEVGNMIKAYHLRAPQEKGIRIQDMGSFVGQLLLRCFDRSEKIFTSMQCRGFQGEYAVINCKPMEASGIILGLGIVVAIFLLRWFSLPLLIESMIIN